MGGVGIAQDVEPGAAFMNPAALPYLPGYQLTVGGTLVTPDIRYRSAAGTEGMKTVPNLTPNFAASFPIIPGTLHGGIAVEAPFGGDFQFSDTGAMRYLATKAVLAMADITPSVGLKINDSLSVGASLHYYDVVDLTRNAAVNVGTGQDAADSLHATGQHLGAGASLMYKPSERHSIGLAYRSQTRVHVDGTFSFAGLNGPITGLFGTNYETGAHTDLVVPATVGLGWQYRPNRRWTIEADASWYGWSANHSLAVSFDETNAARLGVLNTNAEGGQGPEPKNWYNVTSGALGVEYAATPHLRFRGGYAYEPSVGPQSTWHPEEMDLTRHEFTIGTGMDFQKDVRLDLAYFLVAFASRSVSNNVGLGSGTPVNGTWSGVTHLVSLNLSTRF
jgi:long-chain fatty acid transport protein